MSMSAANTGALEPSVSVTRNNGGGFTVQAYFGRTRPEALAMASTLRMLAREADAYASNLQKEDES